MFSYIDEAGIQRSDKWCVVSGWVASPDVWDSFTARWEEILAAEEIERGFHSLEFFNRAARNSQANQYTGWDDARREKFLKSLLAIMVDHDLTPIGRAINVPDFHSLEYQDRRFLTGGILRLFSVNGQPRIKWKTHGSPNRPYFAGFVLVILDAILATDPATKLHFVFDRQDLFKARARESFEELIQWAREFDESLGADRLGDITYSSSNDRVALQVADLHSYIWNSRLVHGGSRTHEIGLAMDAISKKQSRMEIINAERMTQVINALKKGDWTVESHEMDEREHMTRIAYLEAALEAAHGEDADSVSALAKYTMQVEAERSQLKVDLAAANEQLMAR